MKHTLHGAKPVIHSVPFALIICCLSGLVAGAIAQDESGDPRSVVKETTEKIEVDLKEKQIQELQKIVMKQACRVEESLRKLCHFKASEGVAYYSGVDYKTTLLADRAKIFANQQTKIEYETIMIEGQIDSLRKLSDDELVTVAAGMDLPENTIKSLYPKYLEAKRLLFVAKSIVSGEEDPAIQQQVATTESLRRDLEKGVTHLRMVLELRFKTLQTQLREISAKSEEALKQMMKRDFRLVHFHQTTREYEADLVFLEELKEKLRRLETQQ